MAEPIDSAALSAKEGRPPSSAAALGGRRAGRPDLYVRLDRIEADLGEGVVGTEGEGDPLTASTPPHLRSCPKDRRAPPAPWTDTVVDGYRCGRIPLWTDTVVDGSCREGGGRGTDGYPEGYFLLIWIILGRGLFRLVGSKTSGLGWRWWRGELGASGASGEGRLSERGSRLRTAGGGGDGRRSSGDLGPHPSRADFRELVGEGSRPGGTLRDRNSDVSGIESESHRDQMVDIFGI
jgi:hypothetical protein